jgi:hypothetical protein
MGFQNQVNLQPAPGVVGAIASMNPLATVDAGPGGLTAGANGVAVGRFAWNTYAVAGGPGVANNTAGGVPRKPDGFISNQQQGLITTYLAESGLLIPKGKEVTEHQRGDFWVSSTLSEAVLGYKAFANLFSGQVLIAAAGAFPVNVVGAAASVTASTVAGSYTMTISATGTAGVKVGQLVIGLGVPPSTYVESIGTYNGTSGTIFLSQAATLTETAKTYTTALPEATGGWSASDVDLLTTNMFVETLTNGVIVPGQIVSGTGIPAGTYIVAQVDGTPGAGGNYTLSASCTTETAEAVTGSAWIETDWYCNSAGNVMDLVKIGVRN